MELVRAAALTGYFEVAQDLRLDVIPLLRKAGISRSMITNQDLMLPARSVVRLLEDSAEASGSCTFGLLMAERRQLSDLGTLSLLIAHQPTLRDALNVLSEYRNRINTNLTLQVETHGDTVILSEHFVLNPPMFSRQTNDLALGVLYKLCRALMPDEWRPHCICFGYARPDSPGRRIFERLFDCPMQFGCDFDGIVVDLADLDRESPRADSALASHARMLVTATIGAGVRSVSEEVEQSIRLLLPYGRASISAVAHALGTNVRTLQRRLEEENTSFSELLYRVRIQQVGNHFANRQLRLTDVAHLLGYAGLASFSAWYRARFHETPREGRRKSRESSGPVEMR
jgi:AraC-like DNA-binding protein